eukprot:6003001-Lingulodinium_polyedra.AAC.1
MEPAEREKLEVYAHQLHCRTGHGSLLGQAQALEGKGCRPEMIAVARRRVCSACEEAGRPPPRM